MDRAIEVWEGEGGSRRWVTSKVAQSARHHRTLWIGVLYAITIIVVLAVVARL
jgi:type IV secretory pathway component VirB8